MTKKQKQTPRQKGTNPRASGTNPRAKGTNPKALGTNPGRGLAKPEGFNESENAALS
jgi:hypothetical protein